MIIVSNGYTPKVSEVVISNVDSHDDLSAAPELIILHKKARLTNLAEIHAFHKISDFSCFLTLS